MTYTQYKAYVYNWNLLPMLSCQHHACKKPHYILMPKGLDNQSLFIKWQIKLEDFIFTFRARRFYPRFINRNAERFYLCTIIRQPCGKNWKVSSLLFELKSFILALSIDMLKRFIFTLLLEVISVKRKNGRTWFSYNWYLATLKVADS